MQLNLPILEQLSESKQILIAGIGGGYDIFCGLPIFLELKQRGYAVHLANLTFSNVVFSASAALTNTLQLTDTLVGVNPDTEALPVYFPEYHLTQWLQQKFSEKIPIWCFKKTGVQPLITNYKTLVKHLSIDAILLIDGGVDSLCRGDEDNMGTVAEDAVSLAAVSQITEVPVRLLGCLGLGAERDITYSHILENIASLAECNGFLGSCSLIKQMPVYQAYEEAVLFVQNQQSQEPSIINSSIISAVRGNFGNYHLTSRTEGSQLWISPLMSIYWFFEFSAILQQQSFLSQLIPTETFGDVMRELVTIIQTRPRREVTGIPLP